jgi:2-methylcitrate dehydratase PrpD
VTVKNHAACGHTHAAIDAMRELRAMHELSGRNVAAIRVATYAKALEVAGNRDPRTAFEAQFSLGYCVAVALVTGSVRLDAFSPARLADPAIRDVMARTTMAVDPEADAAYPNQRAAVIEVDTTDDRQLRCRAPTRKGDPDFPLTDDELFDKFHELVVPAFGEGGAKRLLDYLMTIDDLEHVTSLPLVRPAAAAYRITTT